MDKESDIVILNDDLKKELEEKQNKKLEKQVYKERAIKQSKLSLTEGNTDIKARGGRSPPVIEPEEEDSYDDEPVIIKKPKPKKKINKKKTIIYLDTDEDVSSDDERQIVYVKKKSKPKEEPKKEEEKEPSNSAFGNAFLEQYNARARRVLRGF